MKSLFVQILMYSILVKQVMRLKNLGRDGGNFINWVRQISNLRAQ